MKGRKQQFAKTIAAIGCLVVQLFFAQFANGTALRGRLIRVNGAPAAGVVVTVYSQAFGRSAPTRTGPDGMYYFQVPAGEYYLEVWINPTPGARPVSYAIQIAEPYTDIAPIKIG